MLNHDCQEKTCPFYAEHENARQGFFSPGQRVSFPRSDGSRSVGTIAEMQGALNYGGPSHALIRWTENRPAHANVAEEYRGNCTRHVEVVCQKSVPLSSLVPA